MSEIKLQSKSYILRLISQLFTSSIMLFLASIILSFALMDNWIWLFLLIVFLIYVALCFYQSINYIYLISFNKSSIEICYLKFDNPKGSIQIPFENVSVKEIHNPAGIASMLGNYVVFYNKNKPIFKQYLICDWNNKKEVKRLFSEISARKINK